MVSQRRNMLCVVYVVWAYVVAITVAPLGFFLIGNEPFTLRERTMNRSNHSRLHDSRLVQLLRGLDETSHKVSNGHFSDRFGQLVDLSGSINLAATLGKLKSVSFEPNGMSVAAVTDAFLKGRQALLRSVAESFAPDVGSIRDKLPTPAGYHTHCKLTKVYTATRSKSPQNHDAAYEPYRKFYVRRQSELGKKIRILSSDIRAALSGLSPQCARLSLLDQGLSDILSARRQELFAVIPRLLGNRFRQLLDENWDTLPREPTAKDLAPWMKPGGWLGLFCVKMQQILLAEMAVRLLPVVGMVESLSDESIWRCTHEGAMG